MKSVHCLMGQADLVENIIKWLKYLLPMSPKQHLSFPAGSRYRFACAYLKGSISLHFRLSTVPILILWLDQAFPKSICAPPYL